MKDGVGTDMEGDTQGTNIHPSLRLDSAPATMSSYIPSKIDLKPKRYHGYAFLLFIMGTLFPPMGSSSPRGATILSLIYFF